MILQSAEVCHVGALASCWPIPLPVRTNRDFAHDLVVALTPFGNA
jgi:hypothetical protein